MLSAPLIANGRLLGVLTWTLSDQHQFDEDEVAYVNSLATFLALALNNSILAGRLKHEDHLRNEWLSVVSHEIKNALSALTLRVGLADEQCARTCPGATQLNAHLAEALHDSEVVLRLLADLTDVSLLDAERLPITPRPTLLEPLIRRCADSLEREVTLRLGVKQCTLNIDPMRIEQVIMNLLSNAVKYGVDTVPIEVRINAAGERVRIAVCSGGDELQPDVVANIFKKYLRARMTAGQRGLGLGLYIARGIAQAHGGDLRYRRGKGRNVFELELPAGLAN